MSEQLVQLVLSNSLLRSYASCDRKGVIQGWHRLTAPTTNVPMLAGGAVHAALAAYLATGDSAQALVELWQEYSAVGGDPAVVDPKGPRARLTFDNVRRVLHGWFERNPLDRLPFVVEAVEEPFGVELAPDLVYVGVLDGRVRGRADGLRYTLEHKTTGQVSKDWIAGYHTDAQNSSYLWADERLTGDVAVGAFVNAVELSKSPDSDRRCNTHKMKYAECGEAHNNSALFVVTRREDQLEAWARDATALAYDYWNTVVAHPALEDVQAITPTGMWTGECSWCPYREWCAQGAAPQSVEGMLVEDTSDGQFGAVRSGRWYDRETVAKAVAAKRKDAA